MRIVTSNIKSNPVMRQAYVTSDIGKVKKLGGVILWQEIAPARYKIAVEDEASDGDATFAHFHLNTECPISVDTRYWAATESGARMTHPGKKGVSPSRYITWVRLRRLPHKNVTIVVMNSHYVSKAWGAWVPFQTWRKRMWNLHHAIFKELVVGFVEDGTTVLGGGDWNRANPTKFVPQQQWLSTGGIDHLFAAQGMPTTGAAGQVSGFGFVLQDQSRVGGLHTDHNARVAHGYLSARTKMR